MSKDRVDTLGQNQEQQIDIMQQYNMLGDCPSLRCRTGDRSHVWEIIEIGTKQKWGSSYWGCKHCRLSRILPYSESQMLNPDLTEADKLMIKIGYENEKV